MRLRCFLRSIKRKPEFLYRKPSTQWCLQNPRQAKTILGRQPSCCVLGNLYCFLMDSGWLKALELPAKITGGILVGSVVALYLNSVGALDLAQIGPWLSPAISIAAIFSGALFLASIINELMAEFRSWLTKKAADAEVSAEKEAAASAAKAKALAHLDALSEEEIYIVAEALKEGSPSVKCWLHSGGAAQLVHKKLLDQLPGAVPHQPLALRVPRLRVGSDTRAQRCIPEARSRVRDRAQEARIVRKSHA